MEENINNKQDNIEIISKANTPKEPPHQWQEYEEENKSNRWSFSLILLVISFIIFVVVGIYFGISYYYKNNSISINNIVVNLNINKSIDSGLASPASVSVTNYNKLPLLDSKIKIEYESGKKKNGDVSIVRQEMPIGDISYNQTFSSSTDFIFYGVEGDIRNINVHFEYKISNGQVFVKDITDIVSIFKANVTMEMESQQKSVDIIENNRYGLKLKIKNINTEKLSDSFLILNIPRSFILDKASDLKDVSNFKLPDISPNMTKEYNILGYFSEISNAERIFRASLYNKDGVLLKQVALEPVSTVSPLSVDVSYIVDFSEVSTVQRNTKYKLNLVFANNSSDAYTGIFVHFKENGNDRIINNSPLFIGSGQRATLELDVNTPNDIYYKYNVYVMGRKKGIFEDTILLNRDITTQLK